MGRDVAKSNDSRTRGLRRGLAIVVLPLLLSACSGSLNGADGIHDPYEATNRVIHENNKRIDRAVIRPLALAYVEGTPPGLQESIRNFRINFSTPGMVVNDLLQLNGEDALVNTLRFALNTVVGLGGLVDVAGLHGLPARETDFGETLHFWRVTEGAYLELPLRGPTTERDAVGGLVDFFLNPMRYLLPVPERYAGSVARVFDLAGSRGRFAETVDSVLYDSADSYIQYRNTYLQRRRYELGGDETIGDPYLDPYGTGDPYVDPYTE
ncbi:MAG: VacJ family lipoprotein [Pseudooceanicola sp.]|nr:VacJ family lipoprotein [Pseudooceanicola sp.]